MSIPTDPDVTRLLHEVREGRDGAVQDLAEAVYDELHRLAAHYLEGERRGHTLEATALVHEAYVRLVGRAELSFDNRCHFFGVAARTIRSVLVDHARSRAADKRGGGRAPLELAGLEPAADGERAAIDLLALDDALVSLEAVDPRHARVVELRFFGGLTVEDTAAALEISPATVKRDWEMARAWLFRELGDL